MENKLRTIQNVFGTHKKHNLIIYQSTIMKEYLQSNCFFKSGYVNYAKLLKFKTMEANTQFKHEQKFLTDILLKINRGHLVI